jgi:hypothetical protein
MENKVVDGNVQDACILATACLGGRWQDASKHMRQVRPELTRQVRPRDREQEM